MPEVRAERTVAGSLDGGPKARTLELPEPAGEGIIHVSFTFTIDARGPMGPMSNAMLGPSAETVAQDLLRDVANAVSPTEEAA